MKILHVIPSFAPAWRYGGPIHSAVGLTRDADTWTHITLLSITLPG